MKGEVMATSTPVGSESEAVAVVVAADLDVPHVASPRRRAATAARRPARTRPAASSRARTRGPAAAPRRVRRRVATWGRRSGHRDTVLQPAAASHRPSRIEGSCRPRRERPFAGEREGAHPSGPAGPTRGLPRRPTSRRHALPSALERRARVAVRRCGAQLVPQRAVGHGPDAEDAGLVEREEPLPGRVELNLPHPGRVLPDATVRRRRPGEGVQEDLGPAPVREPS